MLKRLEEIKARRRELEARMKDSSVINSPPLYGRICREFHHLDKICLLIQEYEDVQKKAEENKEIIRAGGDPELSALAREENQALAAKLPSLEKQLKIQLLPKDPNDEKNIVLEIRAGAGGDEAGLFVQDLFSAYSRYAVRKGWKMEAMSLSPGNAGGYKEAIAVLSGDRVYSVLKYESGVHRVQRVPKTEAQGRIHTSTVTAVVLPEADPVDVKIAQNDLRIDFCRASGSGGQHVNTTDSAARVTHLPTKITVYCQQEKSQHANRAKAMKILYARLLDFQTKKARKEESQKRQEQMGAGDRSERIRTYNFPQSRLTDHRIPWTTKSLPAIMAGEFDELFFALSQHYQALSLKEGGPSG